MAATLLGIDVSHETLAHHVRDRMAELGHTVKSVADHTATVDPTGRGLTGRTITHMRTGSERNYDPRTMRLVELALEWGPGTIQGLIDGTLEEPQPLDERDNPTVAELTREVRDLRQRMDRLTKSLTRALNPDND